MAGGVKIPVEASVGSVTDGLNKIPAKVEEVSRRINRFKWQVVDLKGLAADLKAAERMIADFQRRVGPIGLGGGLGVPGGGALPPGPIYRPAAPTAAPVPRPTPAPANRGGVGSRTHAPQWWNIGQQFLGGVGGGFGQIGSYGVRGGLAGYHNGGIGGAGMGLLGGLGVGALAFGAFKIGQGISEGYDIAKDRASTLDNLKRQLGDVGVSFDRLKLLSNAAADGLQINSKEAAELALQFNRLSKGHGGFGGLADATRVSVGFSRSYGLDPSAGVGFFGGMANMDRRQNNRELALLVAEAIEKSGMSARADEVMQAIQGYAASVSRMVLGTGGVAQYAGAYSSLMGMNGMTSETAASILGAANASMMRMGGAGEASQNFTLMAMQKHGRINPIAAMALAEGGLFGTRGGVFDKSGAIAQFIGADGMPGGDQGVSNFQVMRQALRGLGGDKWLQLDSAKRYFGVGSYAQAASLMNLDEGGMGRLQGALQKAGIDINSVNASGIQALAKLGPDASRDQLAAAASANRQETEWTKMQDSLKALDDIKINTGDKLIEPVNKIRDATTWIAEKLGMKPATTEGFSGGGGSFGGKGASGGWSDAQSDLDNLYGRLLKKESGGRHLIGGSLLTSSAGAMGISQVMPGTGVDPGYGITPLQNNSEAEYRRFGKDYLGAMLRKYGGDTRKALAAYNAGPGKVDAAVGKWGGDWLTHMPRETQAYVPSILGGDNLTVMPPGLSSSGGRNIVQSTEAEIDLLINPRDAVSRQAMGPSISTRVSLPKSSGTPLR